jgi:hypothetical protein
MNVNGKATQEARTVSPIARGNRVVIDAPLTRDLLVGLLGLGLLLLSGLTT